MTMYKEIEAEKEEKDNEEAEDQKAKLTKKKKSNQKKKKPKQTNTQTHTHKNKQIAGYLCTMESHGMLSLAEQFVTIHASCTAVVLLLSICGGAPMVTEESSLSKKKQRATPLHFTITNVTDDTKFQKAVPVLTEHFLYQL